MVRKHNPRMVRTIVLACLGSPCQKEFCLKLQLTYVLNPAVCLQRRRNEMKTQSRKNLEWVSARPLA